MYRLHVILNDKDYQHFTTQLERSGLSRSAFVRKAIRSVNIRARPPNGYAEILRELKAQGNNLNQIARVVNATHSAGSEQINECIHIMGDVWTLVKDGFG